MVYENILQCIGNTPIVRLNRISKGLNFNLYAKLEFMNPGGSIKDRIGYWMIDDAEAKGILKPGGTIVEGTSGNTGVGLAIAAAIRGYKCIFVLPDKMSEEKIRNLRAFGAKVVVTPTAVDADDPRSYYSVSRRLAKETPNAIYVDQYNNLSNRDCHYKTTGPEILKQFPDVDAIVMGIGTGGTTCGIGRYFKENKPSVKIVAVDPVGSMVYDKFKYNRDVPAMPYKIEGIGEDFFPKNYDFKVIDDMVQVQDKESFVMTRDLLTKEGIYSGISSGAAIVGALRWANENAKQLAGKNVLVILPDSGNRYLSKVYNDDWMREAGFLDTPSMGTVEDLLHYQPPKFSEIIMVRQKDKVSSLIELLHDKGISQVPMRDENGWIKGIITEGALFTALFSGKIKPTDTVDQLADPSIEFVSISDPIEKISRLVTTGKTPIVTDGGEKGKLIAILTKIDLLNYLGNRT